MIWTEPQPYRLHSMKRKQIKAGQSATFVRLCNFITRRGAIYNVPCRYEDHCLACTLLVPRHPYPVKRNRLISVCPSVCLSKWRSRDTLSNRVSDCSVHRTALRWSKVVASNGMQRELRRHLRCYPRKQLN
jgi:hypothetical protein